MRLLILAAALVAAGCGTVQTVPVPTPVPIPGPTQYVPIPHELTECEDTGPPPAKGDPLGDLFAWAPRAWAALTECRAKMEQVRALGR